MRRHLWPLGLAVLFYNPSFAQTIDAAHSGTVELSRVSAMRDAAPAAALTLKIALERAFDANPVLSAAQRELDAIEATIIQAQVRPNPEIAAYIEDTRKATRSTTLQLNQPIELGGKRSARIGAAERARDAAAAELAAKRAEVRAGVVVAFYDVLVAQERLRLAQASVELAQRASSAAARRVTAGKVSPVEETRARVAEAGVRVELAIATSELATARKQLVSTWGDLSTNFARAEGELTALPPLPDLAELNARLAASPNLLRARIEVERRLALTEVERSRRVPDLTVSLGARRNEELGLIQAILGVSIPIPVFNRNQGNLLEALHRTDKARDELSAAGIHLSNEMTLAYERLSSARQVAGMLQQEILPGAQSAYDAATKGFELGKFNFLDVLDAQRTSFQAQSQYLRALAEAHRSAAAIQLILGEASPSSTLAPAAAQP